MLQKHKKVLIKAAGFIACFIFFMHVYSCRYIVMRRSPEHAKQGDSVKIEIQVGDPQDMDEIEYTINGQTNTTTNSPHYVWVNTCKKEVDYMTALTYTGKVTYNDGEVMHAPDVCHDLTTGHTSRENSVRSYGVFIADDYEECQINSRISAAASFWMSFNSAGHNFMVYAAPHMYKENAGSFVDNTDMALSFGHGEPHVFRAGKNCPGDKVELAHTAYGSCGRCYDTGDLEYLVFFSCLTLSREDEAIEQAWFSDLYGGSMLDFMTSIAFGDVDGDGDDEVGIGRISFLNSPRYQILNDHFLFNASGDIIDSTAIFNAGSNWTAGLGVTSIAFGNIDSDDAYEFGITRNQETGIRYIIHDDENHNFSVLKNGGNNWGGGTYATCIAFGDVDNDGFDEIGIARKSNSNMRLWILDDKNHNYAQLYTYGTNWGTGEYITCIAFGNVDDDAAAEIGIAKYATSGPRYYILDDKNNSFAEILNGGTNWGSDFYSTCIAFGDVDADGRDEVGIGRKASMNMRYCVFDDKNANFATLHQRGSDWGSGYYTTSIAFGDVDNDGLDEVCAAREANVNMRFEICDDKQHNFARIFQQGRSWRSYEYVTGIACGDTDGDPGNEVGVSIQTLYGSESKVYKDNSDDPSQFGARFTHWWRHNAQTKSNNRPFSGLHMALGFETRLYICEDINGFARSFADYLDCGMYMVDAWMEAADDNLCFEDKENLSIAYYLKPYEYDRFTSNKDDYIYPNCNYCLWWCYWDF
jgi:hypothetical protein